jgi:hypothetical protein
MKGQSAQTIFIKVRKQLKEVGVPRKCNTLNIANNKIHRWLQDGQGQEL